LIQKCRGHKLPEIPEGKNLQNKTVTGEKNEGKSNRRPEGFIDGFTWSTKGLKGNQTKSADSAVQTQMMKSKNETEVSDRSRN